MNNYQAQQFWNDINSVVGFATSLVALGFVVSMVSIIPFTYEEPKRMWLVYVTPEGKWGAWDISPYKPTLAIHKEDPKKYLKEWAEYYYLDVEAQVQRGRFVKYWISEATTRYRAIRNVQVMALPEHHSSITSPKLIQYGTCYEDAWRFLIKGEEGELIHGTVESLGKRIGHAWVELPTGYIWEPQTKGYFSIKDFDVAATPIEEHRYTVEQAAIMVARVGKHGPWTEEERARWLPKYRSSTLQQFMDTELDKLVSRYGYRPYGMSFEGRDVLDGGIGGHLGGFIFFANDLKDYWVYDNKKAKLLVKYTIAHEYSHLMVLHEGVEKYLPEGIEEKDKEEYLEGVADGFAAKWVGFTVEDIDKIIEALDEFCRFRK